ncbi:hypothetical protein ASF49_15655 [Methylobacterium sp. Leaf104]|uniref:hypothetical protein n=1 Tax=Methylobacterium TaxID=407 RepID=UPI0006F1D080|nr:MULTISPECIES: hypothetical protein [Methylobacterium]KQO42448.1 hypothetical protein ASF08_12625 [Methylobacterium sp. Leaf85]KQP29594.1 hypothetical protein ASF49_15655 [Methylobacterium sp. Leaf104]KQQ24207.1 hypothetical protein ASF58_16640 [Methylobacterium sp. Leaf125]MCI9881862.1 hypothetical protein [Methylobacterium goesingense]
MRALAIFALLAGPVEADAFQPAPGLYCPEGADVPAIVVGPEAGVVGIDLMECHGARIAGGRVTSRQCYGNGGSVVPYDAELVLLPSSVLLHDGVRYRRRLEGEPCP